MLIKSEIKFLVVHCSDTPDDKNLDASDIHKMHLSFGWDGIGYHKVILRNGTIENGRPNYWIGAHVKGKNKSSIGICLIGRQSFTENQYTSLEELLLSLKSIYNPVSILGHRDVVVTDKTCPNFDIKSWCIKRGIS